MKMNILDYLYLEIINGLVNTKVSIAIKNINCNEKIIILYIILIRIK